jgi:L-alanine-DL-glutamate epimerase-like enolase superfamily enzyme
MPQATDVRVKDVSCELEDTPFRAPLKFGGRVVDGSQVVNVSVTVETADGRRAVGLGSMPLGNVWGWPSPAVAPDDAAEAVRRLARSASSWLASYTDAAHPLDAGVDLEHALDGLAAGVVAELGLPEPMPRLMALVGASPVDAALHDAFGKVHGRSAFACYGPEFVARDLSHYLTPEFRGEYLDRYVSPSPKPTFPLYHLVGAMDPLTADDVAKPIGDGLPETLVDWIDRDGLTHLKIKLSGDDPDWDARRVIAVDRIAEEAGRRRGRAGWRFSLDFNERCKGPEQVLGLFDRLRAEAPGALEKVQYVEQPTSRDLNAEPRADMHRVAAVRPVVIDESLTGLDSLLTARERGYSGVALKTCKGHGQALLMAAFARKHGLFLCVQDLTCPGASFLHSANLAARIPGVEAIEGNGRQYCPAANRRWEDRFADVFHPKDGEIRTALLDGPGLGR